LHYYSNTCLKSVTIKGLTIMSALFYTHIQYGRNLRDASLHTLKWVCIAKSVIMPYFIW